jgi:hypothetical protein
MWQSSLRDCVCEKEREAMCLCVCGGTNGWLRESECQRVCVSLRETVGVNVWEVFVCECARERERVYVTGWERVCARRCVSKRKSKCARSFSVCVCVCVCVYVYVWKRGRGGVLHQKRLKTSSDLACLFFSLHKTGWSYHQSGVNFINVLRAAFTRADPKSTKKTVKLSNFCAFLGSARIKAVFRMLMKLTTDSLCDVWWSTEYRS